MVKAEKEPWLVTSQSLFGYITSALGFRPGFLKNAGFFSATNLCLAFAA